MKGIIYKYTFPDGKVYIGQTRRTMAARHREHLDPRIGASNSGFWLAYQKFKKVDLEILETIENDSTDELTAELNYKETLYIHQYKATDPEYGYNKKPKGAVFGEERLILQKEYFRRLEPAMQSLEDTGHIILEKIFWTKEPLTDDEESFLDVLMSDSRIYRGRQNVNMTRKCTEDLFALSEDELFWFEEDFEYAMFLFKEGLEEFIYSNVLQDADTILTEHREAKAILQIDKDGVIVHEFTSTNEIMHALNLARVDNILNVLKGRQKTAYGYYWAYKVKRNK